MRVQQILDLPPFASARKSTRGFLTALLLSFVLAGCGGGGGNGSFVATPDTGGAGSGVPAAQTGSVTYHFVQAQSAPIVVPTGTQRLRFEFFTGRRGDGDLVLRESRDYAATVKLDGIPVSARSTVVTAFGNDGFPVAQFKADITIAPQGNIDVFSTSGVTELVTLDGLSVAPRSLSLGQGDSVRLDVFALFTSGDQVQLNATHLGDAIFSSSDPSIANVVGNTVSSVGTGTTTVIVSFGGESTSVPVSVNLGPVAPPVATALVVDQATVTLPAGTQSAPLVFTASFAGEPDRVVTFTDGVILSPAAPSGFSVGADQTIRVAPGATPASTATLRFSYLGRSVNVRVIVSAAVLQGIEVTPDPVSIPFGRFEQKLTVIGRYSDGRPYPIAAGGHLTFELPASPKFSVDATTTTVTSQPSGIAGTQALTVRFDDDGTVHETDIDVTVGLIYVDQLTVTPAALTLSPGESRSVSVTALLSNGTQVDVTKFLALTSLSDSAASVLANKTNIVGVNGVTDAIVTFRLENSGASGGHATGTVRVTVEAITLVAVEYLYAGNPISLSANTLNLPRGYVGVFEVEGTFSNGAKRRLRSNEYTLTKPGDGARNPAALQLLKPGFVLRAPDARYFDRQPAGGAVTAGTVNHIVDDFLFVNRLGLPRTISPSTTANSSNADQIAVRSSFHAVAADWYVGEYSTAAPQFHAPGSSARFELSIPGYPNFTRSFTVTVTDPAGPPTIESVAFANYIGDPNIARATPREIEVRVNFPASVLNESLPPYVDPQLNFKLAEANVRFATDNLTEVGGQGVHYTDLLHHQITELGFVGTTSNVPYDEGLILVAAQPLGGPAAAPYLPAGSEPRFELTSSEYPTGSVTDPASYTAGNYSHDLAVFGQSSGFLVSEHPNFDPVRDPGPGRIAGEDVSDSRRTRSPAEQSSTTFTSFNNRGAGFRVVDPLLFMLEPGTLNSPFNLPVGRSEYFRVLVRWTATDAITDVSRDYAPVIQGGLSELDVVGFPNDETGNLVVSGVRVDGSAVIEALDVAGNLIVPKGAGSQASITVNVTTP